MTPCCPSEIINDAGSFVTFIALAVYVNNLTGSATAVGFALALRAVPWFTIGPFAGVLVDRLDRRSVMIGTSDIPLHRKPYEDPA